MTLASTLVFEPLGTFGNDALDITKELGGRTCRHTSGPLACLKMYQHTIVCIQNANASSTLGCCEEEFGFCVCMNLWSLFCSSCTFCFNFGWCTTENNKCEINISYLFE